MAQKKVLFEKKVFRFGPLENRMINLAQGIILWMIKGIHLSFRFHPVAYDCVRENPGNLEVLHKFSCKLQKMSACLPETCVQYLNCWPNIPAEHRCHFFLY